MDGNDYLEVLIMNKLAKIYGYILGDGWIDIHHQCGISGDKKSLEIIAKDINSLYGDGTAKKITTRKTYSEKYGISGMTSQFVTNVRFSKEMQALGMERGKRTDNIVTIPSWITEGDFDTKASFISGFYAAEGLIPSLQRNKKTPRPLSFCFYKDISLIDNSRLLLQQFKKILNDIGCTVFTTEDIVFTSAERVRQVITLGNSEEEFLQTLKILDLDYCLPKEERRLQLITYYSLKQVEREKNARIIQSIKYDREVNKLTHKELAHKYKRSKSQIENALNGKNKCHQVRNFPKFDQNFINSYCLSKTPLNDETLLSTI